MSEMTGLPKIQQTEVTKTIMFGDRMYVIRPWKTKDERNFLIKKASLPKNIQENEDKVKDLLINDLIKPCIIDGNTDVLSMNEIKKLMLDIRCLSVGELVEGITFKCTSCGVANQIDISIDEDTMKFIPGDESLQKINDKLSIRFKSLPYKLISSKTNELDFVYHSVQEIVYEGKSFKDFSKSDFETFFDELDLKTTKDIQPSTVKFSSLLQTKL